MGDAGRSGAGCIGACTDPGRLRQRTGQKTGGTNGGKSLGLVKLEALLLLPVYGIYEGMDCLAGGKRPAKEHVTEEDILHLVNAGNENGVIEEQQREMINNIFEFDDIPISDVMTHRKELVAVDVEQAISDVVQAAIERNIPGCRCIRIILITLLAC